MNNSIQTQDERTDKRLSKGKMSAESETSTLDMNVRRSIE